ncbi:DsbA family protein [Lederbergia sp. NSJ-179]|uniref:ClpXP adapter SpxH family protein n=1 Tax=Lederbergia sp. NSJ-179 TaxID=2931402 RepID=UPI001FD36CC4|nr:ClpXP adapter SpxH family protein [Lederbergia sp. NSJ-179]MCJ7840357.1 DsbA family protein [Lederbergia sp. NSJ-179]
MRTQHIQYFLNKRPMEIYFFVDPFCSECWSLSPILKKLQIEYGDYFSLKYVLAGKLSSLNQIKDRTFSCQKRWQREQGRFKKIMKNYSLEQTPHLAAISIKAAELQGKKAGIRFIQKLQELLFIEDKDISDINVIQQCAKSIGLDLDEFIHDVYSETAARAFQCDLKISSEMEVDEMPSMVFFNENIEDEGIKITGLYSYDIYVQILTEMLQGCPKPADKPPLEVFLSLNPVNATQDLALIFDLPAHKVERQMKKLQVQQKVQKIGSLHGSYWKYKCNNL